MAVLVNNQVITINPGDQPFVFQGNIANNAEDFFAEAKRIVSGTPFPPEEKRASTIDLDYSTDGGANWINVGGVIYGDCVANNQESGGCAMRAVIPRSPGRRIRVTVARIDGVLKFTVFAEIT